MSEISHSRIEYIKSLAPVGLMLLGGLSLLSSAENISYFGYGLVYIAMGLILAKLIYHKNT